MNLVIDAGNTTVKLAVFDKGALIGFKKVALVHFSKEVKLMFDQFPDVTHAIVSSVGAMEKKSNSACIALC